MVTWLLHSVPGVKRLSCALACKLLVPLMTSYFPNGQRRTPVNIAVSSQKRGCLGVAKYAWCHAVRACSAGSVRARLQAAGALLRSLFPKGQRRSPLNIAVSPQKRGCLDVAEHAWCHALRARSAGSVRARLQAEGALLRSLFPKSQRRTPSKYMASTHIGQLLGRGKACIASCAASQQRRQHAHSLSSY